MSQTLGVTPLTPDGFDAYDAFVAAQPDALLYATRPYHEFLELAVGGTIRVLVAWSDGAVAGVLPTAERADPELGVVVNSLPWYGSHGGCLVGVGSPEGTRERLLGALRAHIDEIDPLSATVVLPHVEEPHRDVYADLLGGSVLDERIGQITDLPSRAPDPEEQLAHTFKGKTRNLVRKSLRGGFVEEVGTDDDAAWRFLHATHTTNIEALGGKPKPWEHFAALRSALPDDWLRLSLARRGDDLAAALLVVRYGDTVEYLTPAIVLEHRSAQPLSFLIWHAMLEAASTGARRWNWGGTWIGQPSLHHFKAGFGARDARYSYVVRVGGEALAVMRAAREEAVQAFPFYYLYPFDRL